MITVIIVIENTEYLLSSRDPLSVLRELAHPLPIALKCRSYNFPAHEEVQVHILEITILCEAVRLQCPHPCPSHRMTEHMTR